MTIYKPFFVKLLSLTIVLALLSGLVFSQTTKAWTTPTWPYILLFFFLSNSLLFWFYVRAHEKKLSAFTNFFMMATFLKLLLYLAIIVVYLLFNRADAAPFLLTFFVYYLAFTGYEVASILKIQKAK
ncbi:MAG: hypothetical protein CVT92_14485 [Bacteroidetes bacterium HGW-Bacteroidetes-1]|jgi:F0F1-type ATP synthase assembly protein I|nr:MAG: hypothetical protein CVT92_14485 [Bacteroidetes bacterium HGW-Bacteroidetes-1]